MSCWTPPLLLRALPEQKFSEQLLLKENRKLARNFLRLVAFGRSHELVDLAADSIFGALDVPLSLGGLVLGLAAGLLLLAGTLPRLSTGEIANGLLYEPLSFSELAPRFAAKSLAELECT